MKKPYITVMQDKRRVKKSGLYPIKVRVSFNGAKELFSTGKDCSIEDFEVIQSPDKLKACSPRIKREQLMNIRIDIDKVYFTIIKGIEEMKIFSFEELKKLVSPDYQPQQTLVQLFDEVIQDLLLQKRIGSAECYKTSKRSLLRFKPSISFIDINKSTLKRYEEWMLAEGKSISTVGIYLRPLRAILNIAIDKKLFSKDDYPFGLTKYQIPQARNVKKALDDDELSLIASYKAIPGSWYQKAKDFFLFSYYCNGMNMKDILLLKNKDLTDRRIVYKRQKTIRTNRLNIQPIIIYLRDEPLEIIERWRNKNTAPDEYLFPYIEPDATAKNIANRVKKFTKKVNKYLNLILAESKVSKRVTTYYARHSFATKLKRKGISIDVISESLGHNSVTTTKSYLDSFDSDTQKQIAELL